MPRSPPPPVASRSNHHRLSVVSSTPLSGMPGSSTWSNALTRSLATTSIRSARASRRQVRGHVEVAHLARVDVAPAGQGEGRGHPPIIPRGRRMRAAGASGYGVISSRYANASAISGSHRSALSTPTEHPLPHRPPAHLHALRVARRRRARSVRAAGSFSMSPPSELDRARRPCPGPAGPRCRTSRPCRRRAARGSARRSGRRSRAPARAIAASFVMQTPR